MKNQQIKDQTSLNHQKKAEKISQGFKKHGQQSCGCCLTG